LTSRERPDFRTANDTAVRRSALARGFKNEQWVGILAEQWVGILAATGSRHTSED